MTTRPVYLSSRERVQVRAVRGAVWLTHERPHWSIPEQWILVGESQVIRSREEVQAVKPRRVRLAVLAAWVEAVGLAARIERDRLRHAQWGEA